MSYLFHITCQHRINKPFGYWLTYSVSPLDIVLIILLAIDLLIPCHLLTPYQQAFRLLTYLFRVTSRHHTNKPFDYWLTYFVSPLDYWVDKSINNFWVSYHFLNNLSTPDHITSLINFILIKEWLLGFHKA